ncbi:DUF202 domain-containing protein [Microbacterium sp. X-17]|uniref:DUF202 domain-containing protein n=1 Tax=Microbacterium sp. X-17 TaxID=3144404 RepID=UPI0031F54B5A
MSAPELFDPGLQPERTQLSWRRTALSIGIGSLVSLRIFPEVLGSAWAMIPGVLGLIFAGWLWTEGQRRYRVFARNIENGHEVSTGGRGLLAIMVFTLAFGALALVLVVARL